MKLVKDKNEGFIGSPLDKEDIKNLYIVKIDGKIAAMMVLRPFNEADAAFYEIKMPNKALVILRFLVDKKFRNQGLGSDLINFAKEKFKGYALFADICFAPFRNFPSENCFIKNGFKKINTVAYFKKELNLDTLWSVYVYDIKNESSI